jgi:hypothetical protein
MKGMRKDSSEYKSENIIMNNIRSATSVNKEGTKCMVMLTIKMKEKSQLTDF